MGGRMQSIQLHMAANTTLASRASPCSRGGAMPCSGSAAQASTSRRSGVAVFASQVAGEQQQQQRVFKPYNKNAYLRQPSEAFEFEKEVLADLSDVTLRVRPYLPHAAARRRASSGKCRPARRRRPSLRAAPDEPRHRQFPALSQLEKRHGGQPWLPNTSRSSCLPLVKFIEDGVDVFSLNYDKLYAEAAPYLSARDRLRPPARSPRLRTTRLEKAARIPAASAFGGSWDSRRPAQPARPSVGPTPAPGTSSLTDCPTPPPGRSPGGRGAPPQYLPEARRRAPAPRAASRAPVSSSKTPQALSSSTRRNAISGITSRRRCRASSSSSAAAASTRASPGSSTTRTRRPRTSSRARPAPPTPQLPSTSRRCRSRFSPDSDRLPRAAATTATTSQPSPRWTSTTSP